MAFKMRSPLHNEPLKQGYGKVVEKTVHNLTEVCHDRFI